MNFTHEKIEHQDVEIDHLIALPDGPVTNPTIFLMPLHQVSVVSDPILFGTKFALIDIRMKLFLKTLAVVI